MLIALVIIGTLLIAFIAILLVRALRFKPIYKETAPPDEVSFDKDAAIESLAALIRYKTVSYRDPALEDDGEFEGFVERLPSLYPAVYRNATLTRLPDRALLFHWKGKSEGAATVLMAHYDVVPANGELWEKPPFEPILEDGVLWGRGTLDTKVTVNGILFAANKLMEEGFTPERDIYFAFSGGEEVSGRGASNIVDYFEENGVELACVLDEGGAVVEDVFPGVSGACGLIGIAEKGLMDVKYTQRSNGGHASAPKPHSPIPELSRACLRIEKHPFKYHISKPVAEMFDTLGRHSSFLYRVIFANLRCTAPLLDLFCRMSGGEVAALMRTTVAFTQMEGSNASNVIPPEASMVSNIRLNPLDSVEGALKYLRRTVKNDNIEITLLEGDEPSRISRTDCEGYRRVADSLADTWQGAIVAPYLMVQCSDSRNYGRISDKVYRFSAVDLTSEERAMIHGTNERIRVDCACRAVEFFIRLMRRS